MHSALSLYKCMCPTRISSVGAMREGNAEIKCAQSTSIWFLKSTSNFPHMFNFNQFEFVLQSSSVLQLLRHKWIWTPRKTKSFKGSVCGTTSLAVPFFLDFWLETLNFEVVQMKTCQQTLGILAPNDSSKSFRVTGNKQAPAKTTFLQGLSVCVCLSEAKADQHFTLHIFLSFSGTYFQ